MKTDLKIFSLLILSIYFFACTNQDKKDDPSPGTTDSNGYGYATGKATNQKGEPLANVEIALTNTTSPYYQSETGLTNAKGEYRIKLPKNTGNWLATATYKTTFQNQNYTLTLEPEKVNQTIPSTGGETNFQLKLTGREPSTSPGVYGHFTEALLT